MTKEECLEAYKQLHFVDSDLKYLSVFSKLIKEHFDNPPLKYEELEEDMWIWDNEEKRYGKVTHQDWKYGLLSTPGLCWGMFEENRFYKREVEV